MCGITGKIYFTDKHKISEEDIHRMNNRIKHRGPDDEGVYINPERNVGLGHQRLSIIDLSPAGHEPMSNEDSTVWIVFNGEIYNFQALRPDLEARGHRFKSQSDVETIIHLWEEYGVECLQHLRGMFAFAIWDQNKKQLFLARDRAGKKPLKYYLGSNFLVFASELKAFLHEPGVPCTPDLEAVHHYLALQYVPHPMTGFAHIKKLPAGHYLLVDISATSPSITGPIRYWKLDFTHKDEYSLEEWKERLLACLDESVRLRMISDVPLGAFLSGGIDSSAVVALMARHSSQPVKTFSIGFDEQPFNELPYARKVAQLYATDHHELVVRPNALAVLPKLVWHYEEPYGDASAIPTWYLAEFTRRHVTVALNGDGGDESFAGYPMFWFHVFGCNYWEKIPSFLRRGVITHLLHAFWLIRHGMLSYRAQRFHESFRHDRLARYLYYVAYFSPEERIPLYTAAFPLSSIQQETTDFVAELTRSAQTHHPLEEALTYNFEGYLANDLLPKVDVATMAFGLEGRSPFLDQELVALAARMPPELKLRGRETKYILKEALKDLLPHEILYRKKQGFGLPINAWFRGPMLPFLKEQLLGGALVQSGWFREQALYALIKLHTEARVDYSPKLWALLTLELWWRRFFYGQT